MSCNITNWRKQEVCMLSLNSTWDTFLFMTWQSTIPLWVPCPPLHASEKICATSAIVPRQHACPSLPPPSRRLIFSCICCRCSSALTFMPCDHLLHISGSDSSHLCMPFDVNGRASRLHRRSVSLNLCEVTHLIMCEVTHYDCVKSYKIPYVISLIYCVISHNRVMCDFTH